MLYLYEYTQFLVIHKWNYLPSKDWVSQKRVGAGYRKYRYVHIKEKKVSVQRKKNGGKGLTTCQKQ